MQAGLPVACTNIGGPPEVIPDTELLCEPADPAALANAIKAAYASRNEIGARNQSHISDQYAPSVIVPQVIDLYETPSGSS